MGFDNECILNIQSLAGEYFCPVCRLLVYPNEALQSQCTHLYCKPCLTYVVSTTRACPYDGYLVTEADSKPLIESNKSLAETIGKIGVHCLYHRSGCTWQGSLSDCTAHCSGCAFGNSAVVCNRCGTQIVHRHVQEHALTCPGVQPQAQQAEGAAVAATTDQTQSATQAAAATSQAQPLQTDVAAPGKDLIQQSVSSSQGQSVVQAAAPTPEQWYQQQQQYQQYYQQYPGYDPYQQQYQQFYPYQQTAVRQYQQLAPASNATGQLQSQLYMQPQTQPQTQPQASHIQAPVAMQPHSQAQINPQQQVPPVILPHSQIQSQSYPPAPTQPYPQPQVPLQPHPQPVQMPQYQQLHPRPQLQQQIPSNVQPHIPPSQPHSLSQAQPLGQLQPNPQPNQPSNANFQSQTPHPAAHAVIGHSYPQLNDPQMQIGGPQQNAVHAQPQVLSNSQSQNPVQMQSQLPKQAPLMRPPHSHATIPSQEQPSLLPLPGQVKNNPSAQQQAVQQPYFQQPGQPVHQRPIMQPVQQTFPQQHYQQQLPMPSQLRPAGQSHLFPLQTPAYPQPSMQHAKSPNSARRPSIQNQGIHAQPYLQSAGGVIRPMHPGTNQQASNQNSMLKTNNQMQLPSEQFSSANSKATLSELQGNHVFVKGSSEQEVEASSHKTDNVANNSDTVPVLPPSADEVKTEKSETDKADQTNETYLSKNGNPMVMPIVKENNVESTLKNSRNGKSREELEKRKNSTVGDKDVVGALQKKPPFQAVERHDGQGGNLLKDEFWGFPHSNQVQAHQLPGLPSSLHVLPPGPPHQTQGLGAPETHFRPQVPVHPLCPPGGVLGPSQYGPSQQGEPIGAQSSGVLPPHAFDSHVGMMARAAPHAPEMFPNQRPNFMDNRGLDPQFPGSRDERLPLQDGRFNPFPAGPNHRVEFEDELKRFPRPYDRGTHGLKYDTGFRMESGVGTVPSRFLSPYNDGVANDAGERLGGRHEDTIRRMDPIRGHLDFFGPGPGFSQHHMDRLASRSPAREHPGVSLRGFGPGPDDIHGRELRRFGEPFGRSFHESRFSMLPSHLLRDEFEGPRHMRMGDHLRNEFIGQDGFSDPPSWREHMAGLRSHFHLGEPDGFGAHPRHARMRELGGPESFDSFGRGDGPSFPHLGEPGFRSRFSPHGFPTDDGIFTGDLAFDKSRKRKPPTMGWCRICKVECETVEGLDLHSQTREHQKMAMDLVVTIKQNAKKQKITFGDQSTLGDASKPKNDGPEGREKSN